MTSTLQLDDLWIASHKAMHLDLVGKYVLLAKDLKELSLLKQIASQPAQKGTIIQFHCKLQSLT